MRTTVLAICLSLSACAHKTVHEVCSEKETVSRYKDYDQCVGQELARREAKSKMWDEWQKDVPQQPVDRSVSCTTRQVGNNSYTDCN